MRKVNLYTVLVKIASVQPIKGSDWHVVSTMPKAELHAPSTQLSRIIGGIALAAFLLAATFFSLFAKSVIDPLEKLQEGAKRIGDGDLDYKMEVTKNNEIGNLAESFNAMAKKLKTSRESIITEIDERRIAQEQALQANTELSRSNNDLQQFAFVASHDLQEPLRAVVSYLQFIERLYNDKLDDKGREFISRAVAATRRMQNMIQDLLTFSRVSARSQPFEKCNLNEIVQEVVELYRVALAERSATVTVTDLPHVHGDCSQLKQLFQNLIGNGLKFCDKEHPVVAVSAESENDQIVFKVQDNGIGIESEYTEKIFEIFQRLHGRDHYEGTGIGLALVKKIVERHGGTVWVDSVHGEGSSFCFTLNGIA
jgi:light-regulated signal transduction histidine kinase (bacteriophytochrome)